MSIATEKKKNELAAVATETEPPILGVVKLARSDWPLARRRKYYGRGDELRLPTGASVWGISRDLEDLMKTGAFYPAPTRDACAAELYLRFPSPDPTWLYRVEAVTAGGSWKDNRWVESPSEHWIVHPRPACNLSKIGEDTADHDAAMSRVEELVLRHGDLILPREDAEALKGWDGFDDSSLVLAEASPDYRIVRHRPGRAQARRTRQVNQQARCERERELGRYAAELRSAFDDLSQALRGDLDGAGQFLGNVLVERYDSHDNDDWEPSSSRYSRGHYYGSWSGNRYRHDPESRRNTTRFCLARVRGLAAIHEKFHGRRAYRKLETWAKARELFRKRPPENDLNPTRYGFWPGPLGNWWLAEMKARAPKVSVASLAPADEDGDKD